MPEQMAWPYLPSSGYASGQFGATQRGPSGGPRAYLICKASHCTLSRPRCNLSDGRHPVPFRDVVQEVVPLDRIFERTPGGARVVAMANLVPDEQTPVVRVPHLGHPLVGAVPHVQHRLVRCCLEHLQAHNTESHAGNDQCQCINNTRVLATPLSPLQTALSRTRPCRGWPGQSLGSSAGVREAKHQ